MSSQTEQTIAIIQARMSSTRLPGKVLFNLNDKSVLNHVINRIRNCSKIDKIVVATTDLEVDSQICQECTSIGIDYFKGSSLDVLSRYYGAASKFKADNIIRITSDCPVICSETIDQMIDKFFITKPDYLSNTLQRTFPRGLDAEIFTFKTLETAYKQASQEHEKEHVTPYIYQNPDKFIIGHFSDTDNNSNYRWTLDTTEDWELIKKIYNHLFIANNNFNYNSILNLFKEIPELEKINQHIEQKKLVDRS